MFLSTGEIVHIPVKSYSSKVAKLKCIDMHVGILGMLCSSMIIFAALRNSRETGAGGMLEYLLAWEREFNSKKPQFAACVLHKNIQLLH